MPLLARPGAVCGLGAPQQVSNKLPCPSQPAAGSAQGVAALPASMPISPLYTPSVYVHAGDANGARSRRSSPAPAQTAGWARRSRSGMRLPELPSPRPAQAVAWRRSAHRGLRALHTPSVHVHAQVGAVCRPPSRVWVGFPRRLPLSRSLLRTAEKRYAQWMSSRRRDPDALSLMAGGCAAGYHRGRGAPAGDPVRPVRRAPLLVRIAPPQQNQLVADHLLSQEMIRY